MASLSSRDPGAADGVHIFRIAALLLFGLALVTIAGLALLNTTPGRSFVARELAGVSTESGLRFGVGKLEGSLYGRLLIRNLAISDQRGVFATAPLVVLDWRPLALIQRRVDVDELSAATVHVLRLPELKETTTEGPILPDIDIAVDRLAIDRILIEPPVAGRRHIVSLAGRADIADGRAVVSADARATIGDRLRLRLDAVPDGDRFDVEATLAAPVGGMVDGLAGLGHPLDARVSGDGGWSNWNGTATARLAGAPLIDLRLSGRRGIFTASGTARLAMLLSGPPARLLEPALHLHATVELAERRADVTLRAKSRALDLAARGLVDLANSRFGKLTVEARLLRPAALLDDARGRGVRLGLTLDGPFATPTVDYNLTAAALSFGETGLEEVRAEGRARLTRTGPVRVPVSASAARVTGVAEAAGAVLGNLRVDGTLRVTPEQLLSDDLRLRSGRLDATAVLAVSFATGRYDLAFRGAINRYEIAGFGLVDLATDARLAPTESGEFGVRATVRARVRRLDNAGLRDFLGGLPVIGARVERQPDGAIRFIDLNITALRLRVAGGRGVYHADGTLLLDARGQSAEYGPFTLHVEGAASRPKVRVHAARPNVGVQLANVNATLTPTAAGYALRATGGSPYGPFAARVRLALGAGPLAAEIDAVQVAGLTARGRVVQTAAGPFAGLFALEGSGLTGSAKLAAAGRIQRIDARLRADQARLALAEPVLIAQGSAEATLLLYPNAPSIEGNASVRGLRRGALALTSADAQVTYRGARGSAKLAAAGRSGVPFTLAADARFAPERILVGASGTANRVALKLQRPAQLVAVRGGWRLLPAVVELPSGRAEIAGTFADTSRAFAKLINVDLAIARAFSPTLRLGGRVSGTVEALLPARGVPTGRVGLAVLGLTRASLASTSLPVDVGINAALTANGAAVRARLRRGEAVVGQLEARLAPLPGSPTATLMRRLLAAPLSGNFRYDGPAEALWALSGVTGQEVRGPLAVAASFGGSLGEPQVSGTARAQGLRYDNLAFGTRIDDIALDSRFAGARFELLSLTGTTGDQGRVSASGTAELSASRGYPADIRAQFARARLARRDDLRATVTGPVRLTSGLAGATVAGDLEIDEARYNAAQAAAAAEIPTIAVRRVPAPGAVPPRPGAAQARPSVVRLDVRARADNSIHAQGMGLESEWRSRLQMGGTPSAPRITGTADLLRGTFAFAGRRFELTRGRLRFSGGNPPDPTLDIVAEADIDGLTATITVTGTGRQPQVAFASVPVLPQDEVLSRILFGESVGELSAIQALQLASSVASLRGGGGGLNPLGKMRQATGFDRFRVLGSDAKAGRGTALAVGENLGDDLYLEVTTDARGYTATQLEIALTRVLSVIAQVGGSGETNVAVQYGKDY